MLRTWKNWRARRSTWQASLDRVSRQLDDLTSTQETEAFAARLQVAAYVIPPEPVRRSRLLVAVALFVLIVGVLVVAVKLDNTQQRDLNAATGFTDAGILSIPMETRKLW
jgi:ferric-dicitrate binding protein FerR (iron transport regulator)